MALSTRGIQLINPPLPYISALINAQNKRYSSANPDGVFILSVAENRLCSEMIAERLSQSLNCLPSHLLGYTSTLGLPEFRVSLSKFLSKHIFGVKEIINPNNLVLGSGCVSLIVQLSILLFEENDSVLIPTPYYPAFDNDFMNFGRVRVFPVPFAESGDDVPFGYITKEALDASYSKALSEGFRPKALILTNPSNPLGSAIDTTQLTVAVSWANAQNIHLIVDEIYALSLFPMNNPLSDEFDGRKFVSIVELLENDLNENIHVLWSFSKDFSANGLRAGVLYTKNQSLLSALSSSNDPMMVSNITQHALQSIIDDEAFVLEYLRRNSLALYKSYSLLCEELTKLQVKVVDSHGAMFAFCDFRRYLKSETFIAEQELFHTLNNGGILITPGESCRSPLPGFFRICYASVSFEVLKLALQRLKIILTTYEEKTLHREIH